MADRQVVSCTADCPSPPQLRLYQTIIFVTPILFAFMLLLMFCLLYFRKQSNATTMHTHIRAHLFSEGLPSSVSLEQGLSESFRQKLPVTLFNEEFATTYQESQCPVCLSDYQPDEKLHLLPMCKHSFHVLCIDEWLAKNTTCPICRTSLKVEVQTPKENRTWEARVTNEAQDRGWSDAFNDENGDSDFHHVNLSGNDHIMISIERS